MTNMSLATPAVTMTSREILNLLNNNRERPMELGNLHRDIKNLFYNQADAIYAAGIKVVTRDNGQVDYYELPEVESKMLVATKDSSYLRQITEYWVNRAPKPMSTMEMVIASAQHWMRVEAEQEALRLAQVAQASEIEGIKARQAAILDQSEYYSVIAYGNIKGVPMTNAQAAGASRMTNTLSKEMGVNVGSVTDPRFGSVNIYHSSVLDIIFKKKRWI